MSTTANQDSIADKILSNCTHTITIAASAEGMRYVSRAIPEAEKGTTDRAIQSAVKSPEKGG